MMRNAHRALLLVIALKASGGLVEATSRVVGAEGSAPATKESATTSAAATEDFRSIGRFLASELHPALQQSNVVTASSVSSSQRRSLQDATGSYLADFDDICEEMRIIFNQQCSCGATAQERSDMVTCQSGASGGLEASAHFSQTDFALQTVQVCKQQACTVIHYQNRTGTKCEASYGGTTNTGKTCDSCRVCSAYETGGAMMGLEIDCTNVNPQMSVNCTPVSDVLNLSGGHRAYNAVSWISSLLLLVVAVAASTTLLL